MTITERRPAREMVDEKRVFLPDFPHTLPELKTAGYDSVGLDILIGATDPATGGPVFYSRYVPRQPRLEPDS